jgi:hypothetical protein
MNIKNRIFLGFIMEEITKSKLKRGMRICVVGNRFMLLGTYYSKVIDTEIGFQCLMFRLNYKCFVKRRGVVEDVTDNNVNELVIREGVEYTKQLITPDDKIYVLDNYESFDAIVLGWRL